MARAICEMTAANMFGQACQSGPPSRTRGTQRNSAVIVRTANQSPSVTLLTSYIWEGDCDPNSLFKMHFIVVEKMSTPAKGTEEHMCLWKEQWFGIPRPGF